MSSATHEPAADVEPVITNEAVLRTYLNDSPDPELSAGRNRVVDVVCTVAALSLPALFWVLLAVGRAPQDEAIQRADLILGTIGAVLIWWRRRRPVEISVLISVFAVVSDLSSIAQGIALLTVAIHCRPRSVVLATGVFLLSGAVYGVVRPVPEVPYWVTMLIIVLIAGGLVAWEVSSGHGGR